MLATKIILLILTITIIPTSSLLCKPCQATISTIAKTVSFLIPNKIAVQALQSLCMRRYDSQKLCKRVGQQLAPLAISNIIYNHINADKKCTDVCNGSFIKYHSHQQSQRILRGYPLAPINLSSYIQRQNYQIKNKTKLNILHISDIHQDKNYVQNSSINCQYPICCHAENGFPQNPNAQAKPYGSKNCDSPPRLFQSFLSFIQKQEQIDIILATGDYSAHNQWQKTNQSIIDTQKQLQIKIRAAFNSSILIKAQGNNDYIPDHQFDGLKTPKLVKIVSVSVGETVLTFLALNTIAYDQLNLYMLGDQSYAIFQLMILQQILQANQNVYLLGHIPPTLPGTVKQYAQVLRALMAKYSTKIRGQFYGHTHSDQLTVNTYPGTSTATGFGFVCPSISPLYIGTSRSRIYKLAISPRSGVYDYNQYIFKDLSLKTPDWKLQYNFREKYHLPVSEKPITLQQIQKIKLAILNNKHQRFNYIRVSGLNQERGNKIYCYLIDDLEERKKCTGKSEGVMDKVNKILDFLRGQWGYKKRFAK